MKTNFLKIAAIMLLLGGIFCACEEPNTTKPSIQHLKTVLGGCNNELPLRSDGEEKDTVVISVADDNNIHVFVGFTYTCKEAPFQTKVEIVDDVIYMYIEDRCFNDNNNEVDCGYARCYCYYTFDFAFHYEGEINQKYKILLYGSSSVGGEKSVRVIYEGVISRDKEPDVPVGSTDLQGMWKVKAMNVAGELTNIDSIHEDSPNSAVYQDISITIPNSAQGTITGNTFVNPVSFDFEIKENQQISLAKKGLFDGTRLAEDNWGAAFRDHIMFNAVKFDVSKDELKFLDSQDNPVIIFIKTREL